MSKPADETLYTTGDLARMTGNTLRTVRYYEEQGLLSPVPRGSGEHRLFTRADLERLQTISDLRAVGLSLEEISEVLKLRVHAPEGPVLAARARTMLDRQLCTVNERMATLERVKKELQAARGLLDQCCKCSCIGKPQECTRCDHAQEALPHPLVSLLLKCPTDDPQ